MDWNWLLNLDWYRSADWLSGGHTAYLTSGLIVLWTLVQWLILRVRHVTPTWREMTDAVELLENTPDEPLTFAEHYPEINRKLSHHFLLAPFWESFRATLIFAQGEGPVIGCRRPDGYFQAHALLERHMDLRYYRAMPGFLIAAGLLCTFAGLMAALQAASIGLAVTELVEAQQAMREMLRTAAFQFLPAMTGVISGIWFSWREKHHFHHLEQRISRFCRLVDERIAMVTSEQLTYSQLLESKLQTHRLKQVASHLERPMTILDEQQGTSVHVASHPPIETVMRLQTTIPNQGEQSRDIEKVLVKILEGFLREWRIMNQPMADMTGMLRETLNQVNQVHTTMIRLTSEIPVSTKNMTESNATLIRLAQELPDAVRTMAESHAILIRLAEEIPVASRNMVQSNQQVVTALGEQQERMQTLEGVVAMLAEHQPPAPPEAFTNLVTEYMEKKSHLASLVHGGRGRLFEADPTEIQP